MVIRNPRLCSNKTQVLMQKDLAPCICLFKESCYQGLFIEIIFEPHSFQQELDCIYCPQPAELPCDSSNSALTGMPELKGKEFESPEARLFLAITHLIPDGVWRLCPHYSGLQPGEISSVWSNADTRIPPGHSPRSPPMDKG